VTTEPDWVLEFAASMKKPAPLVSAIRPQHPKRRKIEKSVPAKKEGRLGSSAGGKKEPQEDLALADYDSDGGKRGAKARGGGDSSESESEEDEEEHVLKIYYVSRTHTQLTQFIREARSTRFGEELRAVTLGSRSMLCVNDEVKVLKSRSGQNDKCKEMRQEKTKAKRCPYLTNKDSNRKLVEHAKTSLRDLEDLLAEGKKTHSCPYFSSRKLVPGVELVAMPYQAMLHAGTREALGVKLAGNIVIFDEAHNVVDAVSSVHSALVPLSCLRAVHSQLSAYRDRYRIRLSPKNLRYCDQVLKLVEVIAKALKGLYARHFGARELAERAGVGSAGAAAGGKAGVADEAKMEVHSLNDFLIENRIDHFNLFQVEQWLQDSGITKKLHGFVGRTQAEENLGGGVEIHREDEASRSNGNAILLVKELLQAFNHADQDGRILLSAGLEPSECNVQYVMLNAAPHFEDIVQEARAVVLAGGTMGPHHDIKCQLFPSLAPGNLHSFSCGHVVPVENLLTLCVPSGPSGHRFDFRFHRRSDAAQTDELGRLVQNVCRVVPHGVVLFFASYAFEDQVRAQWAKTGQLDRLAACKSLFREPKQSNEVRGRERERERES